MKLQTIIDLLYPYAIKIRVLLCFHDWHYYDNGRYPKVEYRHCKKCKNIQQLDKIIISNWE